MIHLTETEYYLLEGVVENHDYNGEYHRLMEKLLSQATTDPANTNVVDLTYEEVAAFRKAFKEAGTVANIISLLSQSDALAFHRGMTKLLATMPEIEPKAGGTCRPFDYDDPNDVLLIAFANEDFVGVWYEESDDEGNLFTRAKFDDMFEVLS